MDRQPGLIQIDRYDGWMDGWMNRQRDGYIDMMDEWLDRQIFRTDDTQTDRQIWRMDGQMDDGWITRQMGRQIFGIGWIDTYDRQMDTWMDGQIDRYSGLMIDRQI